MMKPAIFADFFWGRLAPHQRDGVTQVLETVLLELVEGVVVRVHNYERNLTSTPSSKPDPVNVLGHRTRSR